MYGTTSHLASTSVNNCYMQYNIFFLFGKNPLIIIIIVVSNQQLFLEPEWALSPKASCAIDSEAMRTRGIIV